MSVDKTSFLEWVKRYFGEDNIKFAKDGDEICVNSPFADDAKNHLWMNPSGGKSEHPEFGSYRCWYSNRAGSLVGLVARLENLEWEEAEELICGGVSLRELERKLHRQFEEKQGIFQTETVVKSNVGLIQLPKSAVLIDELSYGHYAARARAYLAKRKIPTEGLYVCIGGKEDNRILIPYYDKEGNLIWYNARTLSDNPKAPRYMKPDSSEEVKQDQVIYFYKYPNKGSKLFLMEGEFDAISLELCGYKAAAVGGKSLTDSQLELLRDFIPVLSFDTDTAGKQALLDVGNMLLEKGFKEVHYIRPPKVYKDWNKFLQERDEETIRAYIDTNIKRLNIWKLTELMHGT